MGLLNTIQIASAFPITPYVFTHLITIGCIPFFGVETGNWLMTRVFRTVYQHPVGEVVLASCFVIHTAIGIYKAVNRFFVGNKLKKATETSTAVKEKKEAAAAAAKKKGSTTDSTGDSSSNPSLKSYYRFFQHVAGYIAALMIIPHVMSIRVMPTFFFKGDDGERRDVMGHYFMAMVLKESGHLLVPFYIVLSTAILFHITWGWQLIPLLQPGAQPPPKIASKIMFGLFAVSTTFAVLYLAQWLPPNIPGVLPFPQVSKLPNLATMQAYKRYLHQEK